MISKRNHLCEDYKVTDKIAIAFGTRYFYVPATLFSKPLTNQFLTLLPDRTSFIKTTTKGINYKTRSAWARGTARGVRKANTQHPNKLALSIKKVQ